jgi:hypothetical protein
MKFLFLSLFFLLFSPLVFPHNLTLTSSPLPSAYEDLLPYVISSPDQEDAGSCLYMATTGAMEVILNYDNNVMFPPLNGQTDISEVYAMRGPVSVTGPIKNWFELPFLKFNGGLVLNRDVPYNSKNFWNQSLGRAPRYQSPRVETKMLFSSTGRYHDGRWDIGVMTENTIDSIKRALVEYNAPVVVIFRDAGYEKNYGTWDTWHVVLIVGYSDVEEESGTLEQTKNTCWSVRRALNGPSKFPKPRLKELLKNGCRNEGIFYVRESEDKVPGFSSSTQRITPGIYKRSYDWLKYLGNHAYVAKISTGSRRYEEGELSPEQTYQEDFSTPVERSQGPGPKDF